jgi:hypothetical protein
MIDINLFNRGIGYLSMITSISGVHENILIVVLILFALAMIIIGVQSEIVPPILTGIGFIIIQPI